MGFRIRGCRGQGFQIRAGLGFLGLGFRVLGFGFRVLGFGFRVLGFGFRVLGLGFRVLGFGFRVLGLGFRRVVCVLKGGASRHLTQESARRKASLGGFRD